MDNPLKELAREPLKQMREWVEAYKDDPNPRPIGTGGAIKAMEYFLEVFSRHGELKDGAVMELTAAQQEVHRAVEILAAFEGKLAMLQWMQTGRAPFEDDDD